MEGGGCEDVTDGRSRIKVPSEVCIVGNRGLEASFENVGTVRYLQSEYLYVSGGVGEAKL